VFYPGEIEVRTTPVAARNTSFELMQGLYMGDTLCARAKAICVLMDAAQARPTPLPDAFRDRLTLRPCA
jgi:acyl-CoA thioesterase FadM